MSESIHIISLGAGWQSSAMALKAADEGVHVDAAIFADTGDEPKAVYSWLEKLTKMLPFPVHIAKSHLGKLSDNLFRGDHSQIPAFMPGQIGKRQCTNHWKIRPIKQKIRELFPNRSVVQSIGISTDEVSRAKDSGAKWITNSFPLLDARMSRHDCGAFLNRNGIFDVPKSACVFCPYHSDPQWNAFKKAGGDEWAQILKVDKQLNERGEFIHPSCKPIDEVDFSTEEDRGQLNMFNNECEGMCGV